MIIISGHATRINDKVYEFPNSLLIEDLNKEKKNFLYLRHSIDGKYFSELFYYSHGDRKKYFVIPTLIFPSVMRYFSEFLINITTAIICVIVKFERVVFIGIDPLNAFSGLFLKTIKVSKRTIFYSVDFSYTRFKNRILNFVYLKLDLLSAKNSDQIWNVSKRIYKLRAEQGVLIDKNKLVPNVPVFFKKITRGKKNNKDLVLITLGILDKQLDFENIILAVKKILSKNKNIILKIIGNGPKEDFLVSFVKKLGLENHVMFLGYLDHESALKEIELSHIGLALYNGKWSFNYFGDSLKCREYFSFGLPVITTNTHSTVEDIVEYKAGVIVKEDVEDYYNSIKEIQKKYSFYSDNAKRLAKKYTNIRMRLLKEIL